MKYQINETEREITFFVISLPIQEIEKYLSKFEKIYSDIRSWKMSFREESRLFVLPSSVEQSVYVQDTTTPIKPEVPDFNYKENTLPDGENK